MQNSKIPLTYLDYFRLVYLKVHNYQKFLQEYDKYEVKVKNDFKEEDHPRDEKGKFTDKDIEIQTDISADIKELQSKVKEYLLNVVRRQNINHKKLGPIRVSFKNVKEFIAHSWTKEKLCLAYQLKDILEKGEIDSKEELKHPRKDGAKYFITIKTKVKIDDKNKFVRSFVYVDENGNAFYDMFINKTTAELADLKQDSRTSSTADNNNVQQTNNSVNETKVLNLFIETE